MIANQQGKILNLASIASKASGPWQLAYHGPKAFVLSFSKAIREAAKELKYIRNSFVAGSNGYRLLQ